MLGGCSGKDMSNQTGLKHVPTEPAQLESKRSRRRAGGRAAALRRAPSDSDCSGETASLSADSAERAPRVPPPPSRQTKSRGSRRRGSEWEVLEGLKDGQRFEKRPEVFNGYLHKKRKWPLKGWHKRFFVVDGGILVYARSPSDVARGRLHGSVDVGLSVISAKARRRRIDIDADEFIYHLRAKTPDVFRTWLNVLKAHRLYRQHLLTFGARESVPKIHAPLEDIAPTETSSHLSRNKTWTLSSSGGYQANSSASPWTSSLLSLMFPHKGLHANFPFKHYANKKFNGNQLAPVKFKLVTKKNDLTVDKKLYKYGSLCSMHCLEKTKDITNTYNPPHNMKMDTEGEMLIHSTDLDVTLGSPCMESQLCARSLNSPTKAYRSDVNKFKSNTKRPKRNNSTTVGQTEPIIFCFTHKHRSCSTNTELPLMKRSKKSTNMVKYKNSFDEPPLKHPLNKCMLLGKYKLKISRHSDARPANIIHQNINIHQASNENELNISLENLTDSEFFRITNKLTETVYEKCNKSDHNKCDDHLKSFINKIINELYCLHYKQDDDQPVKTLFKCLLDYWINNKTIAKLKDNIKEGKCIDRPSIKYFTKDENTSALCVQNYNEETQFPKILEDIGKRKSKSLMNCKHQLSTKAPKTESYNKERQIQELERLLKNTVYYCGNVSNLQNVKTDNQTTETVNENLSTKLANDLPNTTMERPASSTFNQSQKNSNRYYNKYPPDMKSDIYRTYVNNLRDENLDDKYNVLIECSHLVSNDEATNDLHHIYNNGLFSKYNNKSRNRSLTCNNNKDEIIKNYSKLHNENVETLIRKPDGVNDVKRRNSFIVYLSKYNLNRTSNCANDPLLKGIMSIAINMNDEGPQESKISKRDAIQYNQECLGNTSGVSDIAIKPDSNSIFDACSFNPSANYNNSRYLEYNCDAFNDNISFRAFSSSSEATSKENLNEMYQSRIHTDKKINNSTFLIERNKISATSSVSSKGQSKVLNSTKKRNDSDIVPFDKTKTRKQDIKTQKIPITLRERNDAAITSTNETYETVDVAFVDLLLKILDSLSKCVPSLQKNINKLYQELLKKRDSFENKRLNLKSNGNPNNNIAKIMKDIGVQFENNYDMKDYTGANLKTNVSVNTKSFAALLIKDICMKDKSLNTQYNNKSAESQTYKETNKDVSSKYTKTNKVQPNETIHRCFKSNKNDSAVIQNLISYNRVSISNTMKKNIPTKSVTQQERLSKNRKTNIKDIPLLSTKAPKNNNNHVKDKLAKDYKVYRLFLSNKFVVKRSSSLIELKSTKYVSSGDLKTLYRCASDLSFYSGLISPTGAPLRGPQAGFVSGTPGGRLAGWIIESGGPLENASRELGQAQLSVQQLQRLLDALEMQQQVHHDTDVSLEGASPNVKKDRRKFGLRKKKSNSKCASVELQPPHIDPSNSHMALSALTAPPSPGGGASSIPNSAASLPIVKVLCCEKFVCTANDGHVANSKRKRPNELVLVTEM